VIGVDDRRRRLSAVFVAVDVELGHDFLPTAGCGGARRSGVAVRLALLSAR
jgi:hypothetical protein